MGEMRIKIEDESLLTRINDLARLHNRSIDEEIVELLRKAVPPTIDRESLYEAAKRIAAMTPKGVRQTDSVEILREERDR